MYCSYPSDLGVGSFWELFSDLIPFSDLLKLAKGEIDHLKVNFSFIGDESKKFGSNNDIAIGYC